MAGGRDPSCVEPAGPGTVWHFTASHGSSQPIAGGTGAALHPFWAGPQPSRKGRLLHNPEWAIKPVGPACMCERLLPARGPHRDQSALAACGLGRKAADRTGFICSPCRMAGWA
jgi:hypothetical protein